MAVEKQFRQNIVSLMWYVIPEYLRSFINNVFQSFDLISLFVRVYYGNRHRFSRTFLPVSTNREFITRASISVQVAVRNSGMQVQTVRIYCVHVNKKKKNVVFHYCAQWNIHHFLYVRLASHGGMDGIPNFEHLFNYIASQPSRLGVIIPGSWMIPGNEGWQESGLARRKREAIGKRSS